MLLWGRVSDLYSARAVFTIGFVFCGISNLIISFMTNAYAFYVFRGLYGVAAAATVSGKGCGRTLTGSDSRRSHLRSVSS